MPSLFLLGMRLLLQLFHRKNEAPYGAFFLTIEGLGMIIGPIVSGKIWDVYGYHAPFLMSGLVLVVLLVLQMFISIPKKGMVR